MKGKIACSTHANREATTSCASCGIRLCDQCAVNAGGIDYCDACAPANAVRHTFDADYERIPVVDPGKAERAPFWGRMVAIIVDSLLLLAGAMVVALGLWLLTGSLNFVQSPQTSPVAYYFFWSLFWISPPVYNAVLTAMTGQTVGKQVAGVIVLEPDGHILTLRASALRTLFAIISALPLGLGFWWAVWDKDGETWHDKWAKTAVFRWIETI